MAFHKKQAELVVFSAKTAFDALNNTTDLCIAAHQDDIEIMAYGAIAACFDDSERSFTGVVVSDGAGSPRSGAYMDMTDEEMKAVRVNEQKKAAEIGRYNAQIFLAFESREIKDASCNAVVDDIEQILLHTGAETVYTHNLADKHDTHVAVALRCIAALRRLPDEKRPKKVYSLEVWRGLDWLCDSDKAVFDTSAHPTLAAELLAAFDSQICGGKRYDVAALGRRLSNATFFESHAVDASDSISLGLDITELVYDDSLNPRQFVCDRISRFEREVSERINRLQTGEKNEIS